MEFRSCNQPWLEMPLLYNGNFRTCCYYAHELEHQQLDIPALWHGEYFKSLRRLIFRRRSFEQSLRALRLRQVPR